MKKESELIIYQTPNGVTKIDVRMENETVYLTQNQMSELFQTTTRNIGLHIKNIFEEGELDENSVRKDYFLTASDGKKYKTKHYNLDVIISVGYRVKSHVGTKFRQWALAILKEYMIKGFSMDDERLENLGGGKYFEELLTRIRAIRSSEKVFWRKVLEIYSTSVDYNPNLESTQKFFKIIQNKMHWASHGKTAAELIYERADAKKDFLGLSNWKGKLPTKSEVEIAKNYLTEEEIYILDRLVSAYLDFAEIQALKQKPMHMKDWIDKLDNFIKLSESELLTHSGKISHEKAMNKAHQEYEQYKKRIANELSEVEEHYLESIKIIEKIEIEK